MAAKKDFSKLNTGRVYDAIAEATADTPEPAPAALPRKRKGEQPTADEIELARETNQTRGRKGFKMLRVNMAFYPDTHDYIRTMARVRGQTITQFVNDLIRKSAEDNAETYQKAKDFMQTL